MYVYVYLVDICITSSGYTSGPMSDMFVLNTLNTLNALTNLRRFIVLQTTNSLSGT